MSFLIEKPCTVQVVEKVSHKDVDADTIRDLAKSLGVTMDLDNMSDEEVIKNFGGMFKERKEEVVEKEGVRFIRENDSSLGYNELNKKIVNDFKEMDIEIKEFKTRMYLDKDTGNMFDAIFIDVEDKNADKAREYFEQEI